MGLETFDLPERQGQEPVKEMAAGIPGTSAPLSVVGSGYSGLSGIEIPKTVKLTSMQVRKLKMMLADEQKANQEAEQAIRAADKAREKRDQYCLEIEKQYNVSGYKWNVDFAAGNIVLGDKR